MAHRQTATVSISVNGGLPNTSDDNIAHNSLVVLENTDRAHIEEYIWEIVSKPPGSSAVLSSEEWRLLTDGGTYASVETNATVLSLTEVQLPIRATSITSVKVPGDPTNYFGATSFLYSDHITIKNLSSLPGGTTEVLVVFSPQNPATSFTADAYGTFIVELTLNRQLKGRIGASVRSPHLSMRLPGTDERGEFVGGWGQALYSSLVSLEDGYATVSAATGSGAVGGDLSGTLPNPNVVKIQGNSVSGTMPTADQVLAWSGAAWEPTSVALGGAAGGDLSGTYPNPTVVALQGRTLDSAIPSPTDVLAWDGTKWTPTAPGAPGAHSSSHEDSGADEINVGGLSGVLSDPQNAGSLRGYTVSSAAPSSGQLLTWDGAQWAPAAPTGGSHSMGGTQHIADTPAALNTKVTGADFLFSTTSFNGDVTGTYSSLTVAKLQNRTVAATAPALSEVLTWTGSQWEPQSGGGPPSGAAGGDLGGTYPNPTVVGIQGNPVDSSSPSGGDVLVWSTETSEWVPEAQSGGGVGHFLVFSDDTEFAESGTTAVVKKTFRLVIPSGRANDQWLAIASIWVNGGGGDTAECICRVGDGVSTWDSTTFTTINTTETVFEQLINVNDPPETPGTIIYVEFTLRVTTGTDEARLRYTDLYAIHN